MLNVKYEICIEISCKNWSKIFFAVLSLGSDKKIDKIGTGVLAASLPPQTLGPGNLLIPFLSPISIV